MTDHSLRWLVLRRRVLYASLTIITTLTGVFGLHSVFRVDGITPAELATLVLFSLAFALISTAFWNAGIGFVIRSISSDPNQFVFAHANFNASALPTRTAIVMPVFNEDPAACIARFEATALSALTTDARDFFEFHLLSDTTDPEVAKQELRHWRALEHRQPALASKIHYRRRPSNQGRKVGNIREFCDRLGHQFDHLVVLDADSTMHGDTLLRLRTLMDANPQVGIIQTTPLPIGQQTLFARVLQFGGWLSSEMLTTGLSYWQLDDGCYFGHNAIIRIAPFMRHCELPVLPGKGPLSGEILSHDFAEAAFMRAAGWAIWTLPDGRGSFEELPNNILDYARRDRRWCQGNLQHLRLLYRPELRMMSRLHLLMGAFAYLSSPLWLALIILGGIQLAEQTLANHDFFTANSPFPNWQIDSSASAQMIFLVTLALLLAPKLLATLLAQGPQPTRQRIDRRTLSVLFEALFSALLAPILMVFHTLFVCAIVAGRTVSWDPQLRIRRQLDLFTAWQFQRLQFFTGLAIIALTSLVNPAHLWWLLPVLIGLLFASPLAVMGNSLALGKRSQQAKLFLIPPEVQPTLPVTAPNRPAPAAIAEAT